MILDLLSLGSKSKIPGGPGSVWSSDQAGFDGAGQAFVEGVLADGGAEAGPTPRPGRPPPYQPSSCKRPSSIPK
jgi:hypothetical protein